MRPMHRVLAALAAVGCVLPALAADDSAAAVVPDRTPAPCRVAGVPQAVLCGSVTRPLDAARADGPRIAVHYVVVPATAPAKRPDPVLFFAGGPGQSAIALVGQVMPLFRRLNNRRDIVFIDQRGTGRSAPLVCERSDALPLAEQLDSTRQIARLRACATQLQALPHGDLRHYTTVQATADADAVRAALGAPQLNLVGASYGTRAALDYLRQFPQRVRRVVLDGVAPPDMALPDSLALDAQTVLDALFAACERDAVCRARHPGLAERWRALLAAPPRTVSVVDPASGGDASVTLGPETLAAAVRAPLYAPALAAALPFAIGAALEGRYTPLLGLAASLGGGSRAAAIAEGMHFSVVCAEDARRMAAAPRAAEPDAALAEAAARPYRELCASWPRGQVASDFYTLPRSAAPVLAFSGTLDPVTPPRHGARVVQALGDVASGGQARHVVVANAGHGVMGIGCARDVLQRFIDSDDARQALAVDADCLARLPRPPVFEPARAGSAP